MKYIQIDDINKAKQGDTKSIETIFNHYEKLIEQCSRRYFIAGLDNDDLMQEARIALFKAIGDYDESKGNFTAFAKLCITRKLIDVIKSGNTQKNMVLNKSLSKELLEESGEVLDIVDQESPESILLEKEDYKELEAKIQKKLSSLERMVLILYAQGLTYSEISKNLDVDTKTVDNSIQRARRKLIASKIISK